MGSIEIHVREYGSGSAAVLLLHGAPTRPEHLDPLALRLAEPLRILVPDLPGYGMTAALVPYDMNRAHALLEEALLVRCVTDLAIVGFSGGVYHAVALATRGRLRVRGIFALAGGVDFSSAEKETLQGTIGALRAGVDLRPMMPDAMLSSNVARRTPQSIAEVSSWLDAITPENLANELEAHLAAPSLLPQARSLDVPIAVRVGELDQATPRALRLFDACRRGILETVPGAGHALLAEDFDATVASAQRLLAGC